MRRLLRLLVNAEESEKMGSLDKGTTQSIGDMAQVIEITRLNAEELSAFEKYARLEIFLNDLRDVLKERFQYSLEPGNEWIIHRFRLPRPRITISRKYIHGAIAKNRIGRISAADLANWASLILMSDVYDFEPADENFIGDSLVDIKYGDIHS